LSGFDARSLRRLGIALAALLPAACGAISPPPPANPFAGPWSTAERQQIAFRDDTVVFHPPGEKPTPLGAETCSGKFRFAYNRQGRDALLAMAGRQGDLRRRLTEVLVQPEYPVAELSCGEGGTTYVMLGDKELVAIHRDQDIAGVERWSRL
jgi:hypothetical protein